MWTRLLKEWRALRLAWLAATALPCVTLLHPLLWATTPVIFGLCCSFLGATVFGQEWQHGTWPWLLAQPISRRRLWYEKMLVLGVALALALAAFVVVRVASVAPLHPEDAGLTVLFGLVAWATVPALTLLLGNTLAAAVFGPFLPIAVGGLCLFLSRLLIPVLTDALGVGLYAFLFGIGPVIAYCGGMYLLGCRRFARAEALEPVPARRGSLLPISRRIGALLSARRDGLMGNLVRKEFRLHAAGFQLAGALLVASLGVATYRCWGGEDTSACFAPFVLYGLAAPAVIGAVAVAEERQLGMLEWQLCLPPTRGRLWAVKAAVTAAVGLLLLVVLPGSLLAWLLPDLLGGITLQTLANVGLAMLAALGLLALSFLASSLCSSSLRAVLTSLLLFGGVSVLTIAELRWMQASILGEPLREWLSRAVPFAPSIAWLGAWAFALGAPLAWLAIVLALARANYRQNDPRPWWAWTQYAWATASASIVCCLAPVLLVLFYLLPP